MVVGRGPATTVPPWGLIPVFPHISEGACNLLPVFFSLVDAIWYGLFRGPGLLGGGDSSSPSRGWSFTYPSGHVVGIVEANPPVDPDCSNHSAGLDPFYLNRVAGKLNLNVGRRPLMSLCRGASPPDHPPTHIVQMYTSKRWNFFFLFNSQTERPYCTIFIRIYKKKEGCI